MSPGAWCIVGVLALLVVLAFVAVARLQATNEFQAAKIRELEAELSETKNLLNQPRQIELTGKAVEALANGIARALTTPGRN